MVQKSNFLQMFVADVKETLDQNVDQDEADAFVRTAAHWLGYELPDENFVGSAKDRGIDFWFASDSGLELFQVKSHRLTSNAQLNTERMNNAGVNDLRRVVDLLCKDEPATEASVAVQHLIRDWRMAVSRRSRSEDPQPLQLDLVLVAISEGLTPQALAEFDEFKASLTDRAISNVPLRISARIVTVDDLIDARWRQTNQEWTDRNGKKRDKVDLRPEQAKSGEPQWIRGHDNAVFYCRAIDLVHAFDDFGYQIFEPNVRARITKSKVNAAIRESVRHKLSRKQFRFLNNGVTIICATFKKPSQNLTAFRITQPGVINGLQTVITIHEAYTELDAVEREDFEENCFVLVRLLTETTVLKVTDVVISTNRQNPMQPRNLRSNNEEQIQYEQLFAELGWFYERKQGAWDAFSSDPSRWRTLSRYSRAKFTFSPGTGRGRPRERRVDNEVLAQSWLSLIGMSNDAVHNKRGIFDNDELYGQSFLLRPVNHASAYAYDNEKLYAKSTNDCPEPSLMLVAYLVREFARAMPLRSTDAREAGIARLGIDTSLSREAVQAQLNDDNQYLRSLVQNGMSFLFVDFFGYILFRAFSESVHYAGRALLSYGALMTAFDSGSFDSIIDDMRNVSFDPDDVLAVSWFAFDHILDELLSSAWKQSYLSAQPRSRFNYSKDTRSRIVKAVDAIDAFMKRAQLTKPWAVGIKANKGIFQFAHDALKKHGA